MIPMSEVDRFLPLDIMPRVPIASDGQVGGGAVLIPGSGVDGMPPPSPSKFYQACSYHYWQG